MKKTAVYTGTRNLYPDMVTAAKSLILHSEVEEVYFLIEDDVFPYEIPPIIKTINVSDQKFFKPDGPNMNCSYTYMTLMRAALCHIFPDLDIILSLDVDTIVDKWIGSEPWDMDIDGYYFSAAMEPFKTQFGLVYTNAGVSLYNLKKLRDGKADEVIEVLNNCYYEWPEQDVFNFLCQGRIKVMSSSYNDTEWTVRPNAKKILHFAAIKQWNHFPVVSLYKVMSWDEVLERRFQNDEENSY